MKNNFRKAVVSLVAGAALFVAVNKISAQDASGTAQLSYGVSQVVQLSKANVPEETIISYIQNSGNGYGLDASQIIYLKEQGVSANVINSMINQRNLPVATGPAPVQVTQPTQVVTTAPPATYVPSSTVYVVPDTQTYYYDTYGYSPYYGYYGWPAVSLSLGFGGRWGGGWGGYHGGGGWHGGGGGFHGGGGGWHH